jgi:hypothetical protein
LLGYYGLSSNEIDLSSKDGGELLSLLFQMIEKEKDLFASWVILPRGEIDNRNSKSTELGEKRHNTIDNDLHIKRMLFSRDFLNNSPYKYRLSGINKFEGYIGYIYSNGVVLFEKFYENEKTGRIAKNSATYVMNIYNFLELSKLSRSEIIKSLKDGSITDVYRIFHSENMEKWKQDVSRAITGSDYSNVDLEYITNLINQNTLSKRSSF